MGKKITYLLGAGASANTIPIVGNMHERMKEIYSWLDNLNKIVKNPTTFTGTPNPEISQLGDTLEIIVQDLNWLIREAGSYYTIDTLAKKFFLTGLDDCYEKLKKCLIVYFTIEQFIYYQSSPTDTYSFIKNDIEKRYDSFIATLANKTKNGLELNDDIRILSWNYDMQLELSLKRFTNEKISEIKQAYQIYPLLNSTEFIPCDPNKFSMRKLNGNAVFTIDRDERTIFDYSVARNATDEQLLVLFLKEHKKFDNYNNTALRYFNFAWEGNENFNGRKHAEYESNIAEAEKIAAETNILVVIGYSFPIFNREIDNRLFSKMNKLQKVYIQDKFPQKIFSTMTNAFRNLERNSFPFTADEERITFQEETSIDQFVIPYELYYE